ncbi:TBC1 domain family member 10A [Hydra vulgaris]|uniref:TBC1 domain family member 10A n=1 Tax=Hydra vulgaris TaxID=6087 RepID=A0ABM4CJY1_HYDVU
MNENIENASNNSNTLLKVDGHGFIVSHRLYSRVASLPNFSQMGAVGKRREMKWLEMINSWDKFIMKHPMKIKRRCQKGIPQSVRSLAWQFLSGANILIEKNIGLFEKLSGNKDSKWVNIIQKDIPRTFRHHCMFHETGSQGQDNLFKVLVAFSEYDSSIGYSQALAPIAAVLLMHMPPSETFWVLVAITRSYLPGYFGEKMEAMKFDGMLFGLLLDNYLPKVGKHMKKLQIDPLMYIVEWMVCIFSRCLPFQTVLRIWDMFFCEGVKVLFKTGLSIMKIVLSTQNDLFEKDEFQTTNLLHNLPYDLMTDKILLTEIINIKISERQFETAHAKICADNPDLKMNRFNGCNQYNTRIVS